MKANVPDLVETLITTLRTTDFVEGKVTAGDWKSGAPFYFHGTPIALSEDIKIRDYQDKFPAILLFEIIEEEENRDMMQNVASSPRLRLFFMDESGNEAWDTDDHYTNVINDMNTLKENFLMVTERHKHVLKLTTHKTIKHAKWGLFVVNKGHTSNLFDEKLSGVEVDITINIDKLIDGCDLLTRESLK